MSRFVFVVALLGLAGSALLTVLRIFQPGGALATALASPSLRWRCLAIWSRSCLLLVAARWLSSRARRIALVSGLIAVAGLGYHGALLAPSYTGERVEGAADVTVMTSNLRYGRAEPDDVASAVRDNRVQVLVLEEVTPLALPRLRELLGKALPHVAGTPDTSASGTMVFSAYPLTATEVLPLRAGALRVTVGAERPFSLIAVHTVQPLADVARWRADLERVRRTAMTTTGPVVVAGDFNASVDHRPFRQLLDAGLEDAAMQANAGWQPTWPSAVGPAVGPFQVRYSMVALDHVLTRNLPGAVGTSSVRIGGTDHRALVARLHL